MAWMAGADLKYEYRFDALDGKWDELAVLLPPEKYHALFRDQLEALSEPDVFGTVKPDDIRNLIKK